MRNIKFFIFMAVFTATIWMVTQAAVWAATHITDYGVVTAGEEYMEDGHECQVFHHSKGPDQAICFETADRSILSFHWKAQVPVYYTENGVRRSM